LSAFYHQVNYTEVTQHTLQQQHLAALNAHKFHQELQDNVNSAEVLLEDGESNSVVSAICASRELQFHWESRCVRAFIVQRKPVRTCKIK